MKKCKCGHTLKKPHHNLCYKCHILKQKGGEVKWTKIQKALAYRGKLYRKKIRWYKSLREAQRNLKGDERICELLLKYELPIRICDCSYYCNC